MPAPRTKRPAQKTAVPTVRPNAMSALDSAAKVLAEKGVAVTCPELIGAMAAKGYWSSPAGRTPAATLASALLREITTKGPGSRFVKIAPGRYAAKDAPVAGIGTAPPPATKGSARKAAKVRTNTTSPDTPTTVTPPPRS